MACSVRFVSDIGPRSYRLGSVALPIYLENTTVASKGVASCTSRTYTVVMPVGPWWRL